MKVTTVTPHTVTDSETPVEASEAADMALTSVLERSDPASAITGSSDSVESSTLTPGQVQVKYFEFR